MVGVLDQAEQAEAHGQMSEPERRAAKSWLECGARPNGTEWMTRTQARHIQKGGPPCPWLVCQAL